MNRYEILMRAADFIEKEPQRWDFHASKSPEHNYETPACALGWIGYAAGLYDVFNHEIASKVLGSSDVALFYDRLSDIDVGLPTWPQKSWHDDALVAAQCLRVYAETYFSAEKPTTDFIPSSIRTFFPTQEETQEPTT